jgi:HlyD family secretion protein
MAVTLHCADEQGDMTARKPLIIGAVAAAIVIVAAIIYVLNRPPTLRVTSSEVTRGNVERSVFATGTLAPLKMVDVSTQVSGTIESIDVDFNSRVTAGQIIARLDPSVYSAQVAQATAVVRQAEAELKRLQLVASDARVKLERARQLQAQDLASKADLDTAQITSSQADADVKAQAAQLMAAQAALKQAQVNLDHTIIRSPLTGVVVNRAVDVGQTVAASFQSPTLFTIADMREMQLLAEIDQSEVGGLKPGKPATFVIESIPNRTFHGKVADMRLQPIGAEDSATATSGTTGASSGTPTASQGAGGSASGATGGGGSQSSSSSSSSTTGTAGSIVVSYDAVIDVDNSDGALAPGVTAIVTIPGAERRDVVRIPNNALTFRPTQEILEAIGQPDPKLETLRVANENTVPQGAGRGFVWRYERDRFIPIAIRTGLADDRWTEVLAGDVKPGDQLITTAALPSDAR